VSSLVAYTGGNGGTNNGQTVSSTGVTGLTATLTVGTFAVGAGSLTYTISGTPSANGTASFALNIGGQTCVLTRTVNLPIGTITTLSCGTATNTGTLTAGTASSGVSSSVPYTGGNGGSHNGQTVTSTGVTGLTATLVAGSFAVGAGSLIFTIIGTPSGGGIASFALNIGGQTCIFTRTINYTVNWWLIGNANNGLVPSGSMVVRYLDTLGVFQDVTLQAIGFNGYIMVPGRANFTPIAISGWGTTTHFHVQNLGTYNPNGCYSKTFYKLQTCSSCSNKTFTYIDCTGNSQSITLTPIYTDVFNLGFRKITSCQGGIGIQ
jgi:ATP-dependent protease HslVU (ClpYQ) peptidase subunit